MKLRELIFQVAQKTDYFPQVANTDCTILSLSASSHEITAATLFVCMPSRSRDTHLFIPDVASKGAVACIVRNKDGYDLALQHGLVAVLVDLADANFRQYIGHLCNIFHGDLTSRMTLLGVTGTNGKTTTSWILRHALEALGIPTAYMGSLGYLDTREQLVFANNTLFPVELGNLIARSYANGNHGLVMEVSSQGLHEGRLGGVNFDVGAFTNFTQDHLDVHGTMESYEKAKKLLYTDCANNSSKTFSGIINIGDPVGAKWVEEFRMQNYPHRLITCGYEEGDLQVIAEELAIDFLNLRFMFKGSEVTTRVPLGGRFNVYNCVVAVATLLALDYPLREAALAVSKVPPVPGRLEPVVNDQGIDVVVDYAHTPDALEKLLLTGKELTSGRILAVFGCGGDRDKAKRALMASVASQHADLTIVTSDNPRTEDPHQIINETLVGIQHGKEYLSIVDRREAIHKAVHLSQPGDIVVIAGKGHEDYQIIGTEKFHMDDREIAREALTQKK